MKQKYRYWFRVETDNLTYGRLSLGDYPHQGTAWVALLGFERIYGCCRVRRVRVYGR